MTRREPHPRGDVATIPPAPPAARRNGLLHLIQSRRFVTVADVAREVGISEMTVRRDLDALAREGKVQRSHGGAVPSFQVMETEPSFAARQGVQAAAKRAIAHTAAALVQPRQVIGLDVGSTVAALAAELRDRRGLSVVTNSLQAVMLLAGAAAPADIHLLGGHVRTAEGSVCGQIALSQLRDYWLDTAFLGAAGVDPTGLFDFSPEEVEVKRAFVARAAAAVLLCDASKFGRRALVKICGFSSIRVLVSDASPPPEIENVCAAHNVQVLVAPTAAELDLLPAC